MKKQNLSILKLNKKSISNLSVIAGGAAGGDGDGAVDAKTCEGPCQGGTSCCNNSIGLQCTYDPHSISWRIAVCDCPL